MKRLTIIMAAALAMSGCTFTTGDLASVGSLAPSPVAVTHLDRTLLDDKAVGVAYVALDAATTMVDMAVSAGKLTPRSPAALRVADALDTARHAVNAASDAQKAGQAENYATAIARATSAISEARSAIQGAGK